MNTSTEQKDTSLPYGVAPAGYRLPAEARLGRVRLQVGDLDRSLDYYRRVLGLQLSERDGTSASLGAEGGGEPLVELREHAGAAPSPRGGRPGLFHYALLLPDRAALGRFVRHLAGIGVRPGASDHLVSEALYLRDPDGLGIEVYADRPRSEWRHAGRQLAMATEPLDLEALARAAGDETWTGFPRGSVMGHVHLHVGDIERASAFYHAGLGLDRMVWSYPGALFLAAGGYHHHLGLNTWAAEKAPAGPDEARLLEWEIVLPAADDARRALASLTAAQPGTVGADGVAVDPWGTSLRVRGERA